MAHGGVSNVRGTLNLLLCRTKSGKQTGVTGMNRSQATRQFEDDGIHTLEAEFYTEHFVIRGRVVTPERRLSDYLNSTLANAEVRLAHIERAGTGGHIPFGDAHAQITKLRVLFVIPMAEPRLADKGDNVAWRWTMKYRCWTAVGRYSVQGYVHADTARDPIQIMRSLEHQQFMPMTDVAIVLPDGSTRDYPAVLVHRQHVDLVALPDAY
jgi:hypothetical protein